MPSPIELRSRMTYFSLGDLWEGLPSDIRKLVVRRVGWDSRRAMSMSNRAMRNWFEANAQHLLINNSEALGLLNDENRFPTCRSLSFERHVVIERLNGLRRSVCHLDLIACKNVDVNVVDDVLARPWQSLKLHGNDKISHIDIAPNLAKTSQFTLTCFDLINWSLGDEGALSISKIKTLEVLSLQRCFISVAGAIALAKLPVLRKLAIGDNHIGNNGALAFLRKPLLKYLDIHNVELRNAGLANSEAECAFWEAIAENTSLISLNIGENGLHRGEDNLRKTAPFSVQCLAKNTHLKKLKIFGNHLGDEAACLLASMSSLVELDMAFNNVGSKGVLALAKHSAIKKLNLSGNIVTSDGIAALIAGSTVKSLALNRCRLSERDLTALCTNLKLTTLNVGGNLKRNELLRTLLAYPPKALRKLSIVDGPELYPEDAEGIMSKLGASAIVKFDLPSPFIYGASKRIFGVTQLRAIATAENADRLGMLHLSGRDFSNASLSLLPKGLKWLILENVTCLSVQSLKPLVSLPFLKGVVLIDKTVDEYGLAFLIGLPHLKTLTLNGVRLNSAMRKVLRNTPTSVKVNVSSEGVLKSFIARARRSLG